ncbi:MAG: hypothetical protein JO129_00375 [Candidatus Dependentiae bacterium]|nr:hypothetical protein [Candidatus Dependentiae bacterium]
MKTNFILIAALLFFDSHKIIMAMEHVQEQDISSKSKSIASSINSIIPIEEAIIDDNNDKTVSIKNEPRVTFSKDAILLNFDRESPTDEITQETKKSIPLSTKSPNLGYAPSLQKKEKEDIKTNQEIDLLQNQLLMLQNELKTSENQIAMYNLQREQGQLQVSARNRIEVYNLQKEIGMLKARLSGLKTPKNQMDIYNLQKEIGILQNEINSIKLRSLMFQPKKEVSTEEKLSSDISTTINYESDTNQPEEITPAITQETTESQNELSTTIPPTSSQATSPIQTKSKSQFPWFSLGSARISPEI